MRSRLLSTFNTLHGIIVRVALAGPIPAGLMLAGPILAGSFFVAGCGQTGAPAAPSLALPAPVTDLAAVRFADHVQLNWTMPRRTLDKLVLKGPQPVRICRRVESAPCVLVANPNYAPGKPASYEDVLPAPLTSGPPRLLSYSIDILSRHGRTAGESNSASSAAGAPPPSLENLAGTITAHGVLFNWQAAPSPAGDQALDLHRTLLSNPKRDESAKSSVASLGAATAKEQTLVVHLPAVTDPGSALDSDAVYDQRYSYRLNRRTTVTLNSQPIEMQGPISVAVIVDTRDVFAPAPPSGLAAVASPSEHAIDLTWTPGTEPDLASYAVYRRSDGEPLHRLSSPSTLVDIPAWRDLTAQPGKQYTYSVSAIDRDGNQSSPSAETTETLPTQP